MILGLGGSDSLFTRCVICGQDIKYLSPSIKCYPNPYAWIYPEASTLTRSDLGLYRAESASGCDRN